LKLQSKAALYWQNPMQLSRCPTCHARISLDAIVQDEAGRELMSLLVKLDTETGTALVGYLGLFRSASRDLANDKALKLAKEALVLGPVAHVAQAMRQTIDSLQGKGGKPLSNHNYLKRVLDDVGYAVRTAELVPVEEGTGSHSAPYKTHTISKTAQALQALEDFGNG